MKRRIGVSVLVLLFLPAFSRAQMPTAVVNGQVRDSSGAAIAGATVEVFNDATHIHYSTVTSNEGIYSVPDLSPGTYHIQVSKPGFKTVIHPDITLNVQDAKAIGFTLPVGPISDTVTVEGGAPLIDTESAAVSTVVDRQFAENLPLNGRSFETLIQLTPGVVLTGNNGFDEGQFSVNGQRASSNYWTVDGVSANIGMTTAPLASNGLAGTVGSFSVLGGTNSLVSVDALQEFRIQTSTFAPEFGRTPGAQISIVTRSGTNQFHGTAFNYLRNDIFDANNWFNTAVTPALPKAKERQNDFGGTISGPIFKNKTFFFFSYEGLRLRLPQTQLTYVPCDSTCQVFGNARTMAASQMQPFLQAYPLPNGPEVFTPCTPNVNGCPASGQQSTGYAPLNASFSNPGTLDAYSLRIDHKLSDRLSVFGRYNHSPSELDARGSGGFSLSIVSPQRITIQTGTAGLTWSISPAVVNDLRFNYSSTTTAFSHRQDTFGGAVPLGSLPFSSGFSTGNSLFGIVILSLGFTSGGPLQVGQNAYNLQQQINTVDSVSVQKGSHGLKFGVDFRRLSPQVSAYKYNQNGLFLSVPQAETGNPLITFLASSRGANVLFRNLGLFAQDTWRIRPRLTVTYGVRWDVDFAPSSTAGPGLPAVTGFNLSNLSNLALAPAGTPPFATRYDNVAPRIGAAYQLSQSRDWQTVLRGGFGIFYDLATAEAGNILDVTSFPFGTFVPVPGSFPLTGGAGAPPAITPPVAGTGILLASDPDLRLPYTLQWNAALEQAFGKQQTITATYIGSVGRRLLQTAAIVSPNSNFGEAELVTNAGTSNYNAFQLQFQRRLLHGLQALASYNWSHSIDTASASSLGSFSNGLTTLQSNINRGPSDFDIRSAFSIGLTYDLPSPRTNALANAILRGWSLNNIFQARTAAPVNVYYSSFSILSNGFVNSVRPDAVAGQPLYVYGPNYPGGKGFNPNAFTSPPTDPATGLPTGQGTFPRNGLRGFGAYQWDFAVHREFPVHESLKLQFRAEMFNVLNHPNFGQPIGDLGSPSAINPQFGHSIQMLGQSLAGVYGIGGGAFDNLYQIGGPRSIQFALKLQF